MKFEFPSAVPEIPVNDINEAIAYYRNNLGFTLDWGGGEFGLAGISKGNCRMFLADREFRKGYGNVGPTLIWLNVDSKEEVDEVHRTWSASGAKLRSAPESKPWRLHEFTAIDLDGNIFRVFYDFSSDEESDDGIDS
ncbi:MAG TPA: VOC family protein [Pyrinomonadaceae bacterium]|nr:VOC family protein [Pyrinomonadaceae bacterium]